MGLEKLASGHSRSELTGLLTSGLYGQIFSRTSPVFINLSHERCFQSQMSINLDKIMALLQIVKAMDDIHEH